VSGLGEELRPGLRRWTAYHPDWKERVGCVAIDRDGELILVDPQLEADQWPLLEAAARGQRAHVLITVHWHARSAAEVAARLPGARVWAHSRDRAAVGRRVEVTDVFRPGDPLPGGLAAIVTRPRTEVLLWDEPTRALLVGDALVADEGGLRTCRAGWLPASTSLEELREALRPVLDLPVELVLVSHGDPILCGARAALRRALAEP
jgi:glyoxylase-like metal-dependent hydrolase (beta-lactamase superfamily II)